MLKLIFALVVSGIIAVGVYLYTQKDSSVVPKNAAEQFQNTSDILNGANDAVQQSQDLQNDINSNAQKQLQDQGY